MPKAIRQRVRIHDRYQLEIKFEYPLLPGKRTRYHLETYLFIPHNLAINELSFSSNEFYRRLQNYIRFKTPELSPTELLSDPASPLQMIDSIWLELAGSKGDNQRDINDPETIARLIAQFKFLRAILRRTLNQTLYQQWHRFLANHLPADDYSDDYPVDDPEIALKAEKLLAGHIDLVHEIIARFRIHSARLENDTTPERLRYSYRLTDEAISVVVEGNLLNGMRLVANASTARFVERVNPLLISAIQTELDYRHQQGYQSLLTPADKQGKPHRNNPRETDQLTIEAGNERYLHHLSLLKKYTSSALYLTTSLQTEGEAVEHLLFAVVAGVSMIFATVVAFYVQSIYGNFTTPLFVALVVGYMFKDRIKEIGRSVSKTILRRYYYDRRVYIYTLDRKQRLGRIREKMVFLQEQDIPTQIKGAYEQGQLSPMEIAGNSEYVLRYSRNVRLVADAFRRVHHEGTPITGLSDILRLDIRPFLHKMDNPTERRYQLNGGALRTVKLNRVYYINIVSTHRRADDEELIISKNVRVTLNRKGLVRLEEL